MAKFQRFCRVNLAGEDVQLSATFAEAEAIKDRIGDPIAIAREAALESMMGASGQVYEPRWRFTVLNVPEILHIGMRAAGDPRSLADVKDLVFGAGYIAAKTAAVEYLGLLIGPQSDTAPDGKDGGAGE
jgi:hypothetical protein